MSEYCVTDSVNNTFDYTNIIKSPQEMYDDNNKTSSKQLRTLVGYMKNIVEKDDYVLKDAKLELGNKYFFNTGLKCQGNIGYNKPIYKVVNNIPPDDKGLINGMINNIKQINPQYLMKSIFNTNKINCIEIPNVKCYDKDGKNKTSKTIYIDEIDIISEKYASENFSNIRDNNNDIIINIYLLILIIFLYLIIFKLSIYKK
tara:strand:- start:331 stop:933 length:603 start_codon:yes stop_codon:yes gene_type:complete